MRDRLKRCEDVLFDGEGKELLSLDDLRKLADSNAPLTLDELREMDGEPVWIVSLDGRDLTCWMLVDARYNLCREAHGGMAVFENNGETWLAYRRKPEAAP